MLYDNQMIIQIYTKFIDRFFTLWHDEDFINIFENRWIKFSLRYDWQNLVFEKSKIYSFKNDDKKILDETFDELHKKERLI